MKMDAVPENCRKGSSFFTVYSMSKSSDLYSAPWWSDVMMHLEQNYTPEQIRELEIVMLARDSKDGALIYADDSEYLIKEIKRRERKA